MPKLINIYCDESCHLENPNNNIMVIGGVICPNEHRLDCFKRIRELKVKHNISAHTEVKWTKVSASRENFYKDLVNYFFENENLGFRAILIDKNILNHKKFHQTHDEFYYKMYYLMLKGIFESNTQYNIYLDIKDSLGYQKTQLLKEICNNLQKRKEYTFKLVKKIQEVRSHEVELIQLSDILIGAVGYVNRGINTNSTKLSLIDIIKIRSGYPLTTTTFLKESKFNLFHWDPRKENMQWD